MAKTPNRLAILKTYKMYVGGAFPRTESGRFYSPCVGDEVLGNVCLASRKDMRNAVVAARSAHSGWARRTAYNRGQVLYRIAEMLEGRREQFYAELQQQGLTAAAAKTEINQSIDRLTYYSGWCDKYQQIFSSVNPVASSHFNFSVLEPKGVVFLFGNEGSPLLGLVSLIAPMIASGNTVVAFASESRPLTAVTFGEVLNSSDVPAGVVNLLTGNRTELHEHVARHLDIDAIAVDGEPTDLLANIQSFAADSVKAVKFYDCDWTDPANENPYFIQDFCEVKTTWHPIEEISASGSGY